MQTKRKAFNAAKAWAADTEVGLVYLEYTLNPKP